MTIEEFKHIILKQLKDPSSALYYHLSDGGESSHDGQNNFITYDVSLYASEFGLRLDFFYNDDVAEERKGTSDSLNPVGFYDVMFVEAPRNLEFDISGWGHTLTIAEEKIMFGFDWFGFGINYCEIKHQDYLFFKEEVPFDDAVYIFSVANFKLMLNPLSFGGDFENAMKRIQIDSGTMVSQETPYLYYHFSREDTKQLKKMLHNNLLSKSKIGTTLLGLLKQDPSRERGIRGIYESVKKVVESEDVNR